MYMAVCGICGSEVSADKIVTHFPQRKEQYYLCPACRSFFLYPLPHHEENVKFMGDDVVDRMELSDRKRTLYFHKRLSLIEQYVPATSTQRLCFKIGCGTGLFLQQARRNNWQVAGIELSSKLAARARLNNPDTLIIEGDFLIAELPVGKLYNAVIALDVLEHVLSPRRMLERIHGMLCPGGVVLIQTPNAGSFRALLQRGRWIMFEPDYHFHLFSARALGMLLEKTGFELVMSRTVSGSGQEQGIRCLFASIKEGILNSLKLGNALLVIARRIS